ncbi:MAG: arylesterase [Magnetococcus sp. DMHC-6]
MMPPAHAETPPPVILCFGDSLTAGYLVGAEESYPALLQARLKQQGFPHQVINAGVSGDTTAGAIRRLDWVLRSQPTLAIVVLGANDGLRGLSLTAMQENLTTILKRLKEQKVRVILGGMRLPPNYGNAYIQTFKEIYPQIATQQHVDLIPFFLEGVAGQTQLNFPDGIHPNAQGYTIVLENVWRILEPILKQHPQQ